jgi:predicted nucleic acid-binding protein
MSAPFLDASVIVRFVTGDDPDKFRASTALLQSVEDGDLTLALPDIVLGEVVYVLGSPRLYGLDRTDVSTALSTIVRLPGIQMQNKRIMLEALDLYRQTRADFADCYVVAGIRNTAASQVYSYDRDFDRFSDIERVEP